MSSIASPVRGGRIGLPGVVLAALVAVVALGLAWTFLTRPASGNGTLVLRIAMPAANMHRFRQLTLDLGWAGANRGFWRDENFARIDLVRRRVTIDGRSGPIEVARGALPAGHYDRVYVNAPVVAGTTTDGVSTTLFSHIEPLARGFDLAAGEIVTIDLEPIVLPERWQREPTWDIFIKDAAQVPSS